MFYKKIKKLWTGVDIHGDYDVFIIWHFLHHQKDSTSFTKLYPELLWNFINIWNDRLNFKILEYLYTNCIQEYLEETIDITIKMLSNSSNYRLSKKVALSISSIKCDHATESLMRLINMLLSSGDILTIEFTIKGINNFVPLFSKDQITVLLEKLFPFVSRDGQISDQNLAVQELIESPQYHEKYINAIQFLRNVLEDGSYVEEFFLLAISIYDVLLEAEVQKKLKFAKDFNPLYVDKSTIKTVSDYWMPLEFPWRSSHDIELKKDRKLAFSIRRTLIELDKKDKDAAQRVSFTLIEKGKYSIYFTILSHFLLPRIENYPDVIQKVLFSIQLWDAFVTTDSGWFQVFKKYLVLNPSLIEKLEPIISEYSHKNEYYTIFLKWNLANCIPEEYRSSKILKAIEDYKKEIPEDAKINLSFPLDEVIDEPRLMSWAVPRFDSTYFDHPRTVEELSLLIKESVDKESHKSIYDLIDSFQRYITQNPQQLKPLYRAIREYDFDDKWSWFLGALAQGYVDHYISNSPIEIYEKLFELYDIFGNTSSIFESSARLVIARTLEDKEGLLRNPDTGTYEKSNPQLFDKLKKLVITLASDPSPSWVDIPVDHPDVWLNSVRGIAASLICIFAYYYPSDTDFINAIKRISDDESIGVQAQLIQKLVYLIPDDKNYPLCEEIFWKYKDSEEPILQMGLLLYMFRLWIPKLEKNKEVLNHLLMSSDEKVKWMAADLIWQALLNGVQVIDLFEKILTEGDEISLENLWMSFQYIFSHVILSKWVENSETEIGYFERLLNFQTKKENTQLDRKLRFRLWRCFVALSKEESEKKDEDKSISSNLFRKLHEKGILKKMVSIEAPDVLQDMNQYFLPFIEEGQFYNEILWLLEHQLNFKGEFALPIMFVEDWYAEEILKILNIIYDRYHEDSSKLPPGVFEKAEKLFDEWLKYWGKGFYEIFNRYYMKSI